MKLREALSDFVMRKSIQKRYVESQALSQIIQGIQLLDESVTVKLELLGSEEYLKRFVAKIESQVENSSFLDSASFNKYGMILKNLKKLDEDTKGELPLMIQLLQQILEHIGEVQEIKKDIQSRTMKRQVITETLKQKYDKKRIFLSQLLESFAVENLNQAVVFLRFHLIYGGFIECLFEVLSYCPGRQR